jgi:anthranilate phosphoribosyltransferase
MEQVKVNAVIPEATRELIRTMAIEYECTVQKIVAALIGFAVQNMTSKEIRRVIAAMAKKSPTKQYQRTKPFLAAK